MLWVVGVRPPWIRRDCARLAALGSLFAGLHVWQAVVYWVYWYLPIVASIDFVLVVSSTLALPWDWIRQAGL